MVGPRGILIQWPGDLHSLGLGTLGIGPTLMAGVITSPTAKGPRPNNYISWAQSANYKYNSIDYTDWAWPLLGLVLRYSQKVEKLLRNRN